MSHFKKASINKKKKKHVTFKRLLTRCRLFFFSIAWMNDFVLCLGTSTVSHRNLLGMRLKNKSDILQRNDALKLTVSPLSTDKCVHD